MKTQQNRFRDQPATRLAWWGFGLGMAMVLWVFLLSIFTAVIRPWLISTSSPIASPDFGIGMGFILMALALGALVCCSIAIIKGERSWAVWAGLLPVAMFLFMLIADLLTAD
jgi:hypothetical protein